MTYILDPMNWLLRTSILVANPISVSEPHGEGRFLR